MSLKHEKEYEYFKSVMVLDKKGTETDQGPYWVTKQPWIKDRETLVDNRAAVLGVMNSTMRKLSKNPNWREIILILIRETTTTIRKVISVF